MIYLFQFQGRETQNCHTHNYPNSWFCFDLGEKNSIIPNYYSMKHDYTGYVVRNWKFEGSNDGKSWDILKQHDNDTSIPQQFGASASWSLQNINKSYRFLRLTQTGKNSFGDDYFMLSGFEVYGTFIQQ